MSRAVLKKLLSIPAFLFFLSYSDTLHAQTPLPNAGRPPAARPPVASPPLPKSALKQAKAQREGRFPTMSRPTGGGQIQEVWSSSKPEDGVHVFAFCPDCVYKVRLRELMVTTIRFPDGVHIRAADLGDPTGFKAEIKTPDTITVRAATYGIDTNLNVYTATGRVFPFYLRAEGFNSVNVPDLVVKITGVPDLSASRTLVGAVAGSGEIDPAAMALPPLPPAKTVGLPPLRAPKKEDYVETAAFDPARLHGWSDYELSGDEELRPAVVFRDDHFTYLQFGDRWESVDLPTAYVVIDGIDELVNTRVSGRTYIIERVAPLITLKSGTKFLCIRYTGEPGR